MRRVRGQQQYVAADDVYPNGVDGNFSRKEELLTLLPRRQQLNIKEFMQSKGEEASLEMS